MPEEGEEPGAEELAGPELGKGPEEWVELVIVHEQVDGPEEGVEPVVAHEQVEEPGPGQRGVVPVPELGKELVGDHYAGGPGRSGRLVWNLEGLCLG